MIREVLLNTETEGHRELAHHGVLPCLAGGEWPDRNEMYGDGRPVPPALKERTALRQWLLSCDLLALPAAVVAGILLN
jgi:hypothetical protein